MKDYTFKPITFKEANKTYGGKDMGKLPVMQNEEVIVSKWKVSSIIARFQFLFTGQINVCITGQKQPPIWLSIGDPFN